MNTQPPLVIHLPPVSDKNAAEIYCCMSALIEAFASSYGLQIRRYYDHHPQHERPERFGGEPF
ncbi:hypothetical protein F1735_33025 [Massilia sp. CCM 8694]|uniref:Uncharacterized protein n=1 Tax=Massilia genomosp. 1 TaxID=2609280 RepID=A0ABX0N321_9BURK|nr:hypothetical protein [Massilia genomosp. 1]